VTARNVGFCRGRKTGVNLEKNPQSKGERINNKLNSYHYVMPSPGIKPEITVVRGERLAAMPPILP
jgi:UDP-N-acetylmuramoylalanine-D-glutamate ligase